MVIVENYRFETVLSYKRKTQLIKSARVPLIGKLLGTEIHLGALM